MRISTDSEIVREGSGLDFVKRILDEKSLGVNVVSLEIDGLTIRFEGIHSGCAMLFCEEPGRGKRSIAIDSYDSNRIFALSKLFSMDAPAMIDSIDWQEDESSTPVLIQVLILLVVVLVLALALFGEDVFK